MSTDKQKSSTLSYSPLAELDLFALLGLKNATQFEKVKLFSQLQENVWLNLMAQEIPKRLDTTGQQELQQVIELNKQHPEKVVEYLEKKIPDFSQVVLDTTLQYKQSFVVSYLTTLEAKMKKQEFTKKQETRNKEQKGATVQIVSLMKNAVQHADWNTVKSLLPQFI